MSGLNVKPAANKPAVDSAEHIAQPVKKIYDNNPSFKNRQNYQRQLAKLIKGIERADVKTLGKAAIKRYVNCADNRAAALQCDLVERGIAVQAGRTVKLAA